MKQKEKIARERVEGKIKERMKKKGEIILVLTTRENLRYLGTSLSTAQKRGDSRSQKIKEQIKTFLTFQMPKLNFDTKGKYTWEM